MKLRYCLLLFAFAGCTYNVSQQQQHGSKSKAAQSVSLTNDGVQAYQGDPPVGTYQPTVPQQQSQSSDSGPPPQGYGQDGIYSDGYVGEWGSPQEDNTPRLAAEPMPYVPPGRVYYNWTFAPRYSRLNPKYRGQ